MPSWDPSQYLKFADDRLRPALDLIARISGGGPRTIWDLGCGAGNVTKLLFERWPHARVTGVDSSRDMLDKARGIPGIEWVEEDVTRWAAPHPADLVFSNAVFHWVDEHARVFPHLMKQLAPGGVLAVQMPRNSEAPSHRLLYETASRGPWAATLVPYLRIAPVSAPEVYYDLLMRHATHIDIWETEYLHVLQGENAVLEWIKGTTIRPLLDRIDPAQKDDFVAAYAERLRVAYPRRANGMTLFPFRRLFIAAQR
jgi:trans-aconitate 2-methyltransferase